MWKKKNRIHEGKNRYYSVSKSLRRMGKSSEEFEVMLNSLTLEDLIALKLELSSKLMNGKLYGFPIWDVLPEIVRDAAVKYAMASTRTKHEAQRFMGVKNWRKWINIQKKYDINYYFDESEKSSRKSLVTENDK